MTAEETQDMHELYSISPALTCQCDEEHTCQQCWEEQMQKWEEQELDDFKHLKIEEI